MSSSRELIDDVFNRWEKVFGGYSELRLTLTQKEADIFELDSFLRSSANGGIASDIDDQEEISRVKDFVAKIATHDLGFMKTLEVLTTIVNSYKNIAQGVDCEECGGTGESDTECYECDGQGEFYRSPDPDVLPEQCKECNGTGEFEDQCYSEGCVFGKLSPRTAGYDVLLPMVVDVDDLEKALYENLEYCMNAGLDKALENYDEIIKLTGTVITQKPTLKLTGEDGNIFSIMGNAKKVMRGIYIPEDIDKMVDEVTRSDSYHSALNVIMKYCEVR
jgi:hypothetical protein